MTIFYLLLISWTINGQSYSRAIPYTSLQECQSHGAALSNAAWRCTVEIVDVFDGAVYLTIK
jgi:hypothetical protein